MDSLNLWDGILTFISSVIILYITLEITERFKNKYSKKRRLMHIKFLRRYNKIIDDCILKFEKPNDAWQKIIPHILGIFFGGFLTLIVFIFCSYVLEIDVWRSMAYSSLVNILPYILTIKLTHKMKREERKILDESNRIECLFKGIDSFIFCSNSIIISFIYLSVSLINYSKIPVSTSEIEEIQKIYTISLTIIIVSLIFLNKIYKDFLDKIKSKLNTQYLKDFPFIHITTSVREITGKIQDVLDEDWVILDDNGLKTVVEWNTITILGLKE